jgi:hypothetical protein
VNGGNGRDGKADCQGKSNDVREFSRAERGPDIIEHRNNSKFAAIFV